MMDPSKTNTQEYLRQVIDAEIKSLEVSTRESTPALRKSRHRRNAFVPVLSLPTEVVAVIFSFWCACVTSVILALDERPDQLDHLTWLRVTHVCHQWREIALHYPFFWTYVDFPKFSSTGAAEILARAKMAPLYLEARVPGGHWDDARCSAFQKELQDRVSHICHLTIRTEPFHHRTFKGLISPAPTLGYLCLSSDEESQTRTWQVFVPDTLFDGTTPRLSCIKLWKCDISWDSPFLRGLKHLEIRSSSLRPSL